MDGTLRTCSKCGKLLGIEMFSLRNRGRPARHTHCKDCCNAASRLWQQENKELRLAGWRRWVAEHPDQFKAIQKRYRDAHKATRHKEYSKRNKSAIAAKSRAYYASHKQESIATQMLWRKNNPEMWRASQANYRARKSNAEGSHTSNDIVRIKKAQRACCAYCEASVKRSYHVDHIEPLSRGGSNLPSNLQILCASCNSRKGAKEPMLFARAMGRLL